MRIRAIAFDMDGLLFNTEELYDDVGNELVGRRGCQLDRQLVQRMMGQPARVSLQLMIDHYGFRETVAELQTEVDQIFEGILDERLEPMPGAVPLLSRLKHQRAPRALTTSSHLHFVRRIMSISDLGHHFDFCLTAEDVTQGKPHPEIYERAAARFGIAPHELLVFEDSENGCRAGVAAGCYVVAVPGKHSSSHDFSGAKFIANQLTDPRIDQLIATCFAEIYDGSRQDE